MRNQLNSWFTCEKRLTHQKMKPLEAKRNESTKRNGEESNLFKFNGYDHRAGTEIIASICTRKSGFVCIVLLSRVCGSEFTHGGPQRHVLSLRLIIADVFDAANKRLNSTSDVFVKSWVNCLSIDAVVVGQSNLAKQNEHGNYCLRYGDPQHRNVPG